MAKISRVRLEAFFRLFSTASVQLPKAEGNLYESFVYLETCAAARGSGFGVSLISFGGKFIFRASPGNLGGNYGYADLTSPNGVPYQLHNGIEVIGHSGMQHEADILLLSNWNHPVTVRKPPTPLSVTIECKKYASATRLKGEVRKVVGTVTDWAQASHPSRLSASRSSATLQQGCLHCGKEYEAIFATSVRQGLRTDIEDFLTAYDVTPCFGAFTGAGGMSSLRSALSTAFKKLR
jgi:hypothetical protein